MSEVFVLRYVELASYNYGQSKIHSYMLIIIFTMCDKYLQVYLESCTAI